MHEFPYELQSNLTLEHGAMVEQLSTKEQLNIGALEYWNTGESSSEHQNNGTFPKAE